VQCSIKGNFISSTMGVATMEECSQICQKNGPCKAFTYFGAKNQFLSDACLLFSTCTERVECKDCVTGSSQDQCTCSIGYEGVKNADNVENLLDSVGDELICKKICEENNNCKAYTYYTGYHATNPHSCVLLTTTEFTGQPWECEHCATGPPTCELGQPCKVKTFDKSYPVMVPIAEDTVLNFITAEKDCFVNMNAVLIGKGGDGTYHDYRSFGRGGGSGYFKAGTLNLTSQDRTIHLKTGYKNTYIEVGGKVVLEVKNGKPDIGYGGGDGYSGGGGINAMGGSGGGDGVNGTKSGTRWGQGGKGSGEDVTQIKMRNFKLTPGEGGEDLWGGGGGGVLVNGEGPRQSGSDGEGYGAGGGRDEGLPGVVLLEFS